MAKRKPLKVLLVEPDYRTSILPHGLQKIAAYHLAQGDEVKFVKGIVYQNTLFNKYSPDLICITSIFTYYGEIVLNTIRAYQEYYPKAEIKVGGVFATLMPDYVEAQTGIKPHVGLLDSVEDFAPDYTIFPENKYSILFTSRGCVRKCQFCAVSKIEKFHLLQKKMWKHDLNPNAKIIRVQDNNFVATPFEHQTEVVNYLATLKKTTIDFNSGIDAIIFKEKHAELYSKLKIKPLRFAFDGMYQDGYVQRAIELAKKYKLSQEYTIYTLFNFKDTPAELYYRITEIMKAGGGAYPMQYAPLDDMVRKFVGENWNEKELKNFNKLIRCDLYAGRPLYLDKNEGIKVFQSIFGRNDKEFVEILNSGKKTRMHMNHGNDVAKSIF